MDDRGGVQVGARRGEHAAPPVMIRGYELRDRIGEGGFGTVYRAFQPAVHRDVAIKVIKPEFANQPEFIRRFEQEAQLVARLEHLHIVPLYDYWREPDGAFLVMRLLPSGSLRDVLAEGPLSPSVAGRLLDQVGGALAAAHRAGVVHRDLKPDNILLDHDGNAYLSDFGIAKDMEASVELTRSGQGPGSPAYMAPEQLTGEDVSLRTDVYGLGLVLYEALSGRHAYSPDSLARLVEQQLGEPLPSLEVDFPSLPVGSDAVLQRATAKDPRDRYGSVDEFVREFGSLFEPTEKSTLFPITPALANPYKGLRPFREADVADFFGRTELTARLVERVEQERFLALVGPSGSGKSSAVRAGLLPALRAGAIAGSERWFLTDMIPGSRPFDELEAALLRVAVNPPATLLGQLRRDDGGLRAAVARILPSDDAELVLVIDQFEELFTLSDRATQTAFLDVIVAAVSEMPGRLRVVVTLRADFYDRPLQHETLGELMRTRTETVLPLTRDQLEDAISAPAERVGVRLESGLAAEMIHDVVDEPGGLPLLQYALTELFDRRRDNRLTLGAYENIGGVTGALAARAEDVFVGLGPEAQQAARDASLRLVTISEGATATRRRMLRPDVEQLGDPEIVGAVLDAFGEARLLTFDRDPESRTPTVEVAHEALLAEWPRLRRWIEDKRHDLIVHGRLTAAVADWDEADEDSGYLLRAGRLDYYESWATESDFPLTEAERGFLAASREHDEEERAGRRRRRLTILGVLAGAAAVATIMAIVAFVSRQSARDAADLAEDRLVLAVAEADRADAQKKLADEQRTAAEAERDRADGQARLARSRELAAAAINVLDEDPELSVLLATRASATGDEPTPEAVSALHEALLALRTLATFPHVEGALSPDGQTVAYRASDTNVVGVVEVATGRDLWTEEVMGDGEVGELFFSPDGAHVTMLVAEERSAGSTILTFAAATGESRQTSIEGLCHVNLVTDGSGRIDPSRTVWMIGHESVDTTECNEEVAVLAGLEIDTGVLRTVAEWPTGAVSPRFPSVSADGRRFAMVVEERVTVLDLASGDIVFQSDSTHDGSVTTLNGDGSVLMVAGRGPSYHDDYGLWDAASGALLTVFRGIASFTESAVFSADESRVVTVGRDGRFRVWDTATGEQLYVLPVNGYDPSMSSDGRLVLGNSGVGATLWTAVAHGELGAVDVPSGVRPTWGLELGGGRGIVRYATAVDAFSVVVFDVASGTVEREISPTTGQMSALSPDGRMVAAQHSTAPGTFGAVRLYEADTGAPIRNLYGLCAYADYGGPQGRWSSPDCRDYPELPFAGWVQRMWFSPDSRYLAAVVRPPFELLVWEVANGELVYRARDVFEVAFDPASATLLMAADGTVQVDTSTWSTVVSVDLEQEPGRFLYTPDAARVVTYGDAGIVVYDTADWSVVAQPDYHTEWFLDWAISPDGATVAFGCRDGFARIFDLRTLTETMAIPFGDPIQNVEFSDDTHLMVTTVTSPVVVVTTDLAELLELAAERVTRDFDYDECVRYRIDPCPDPGEDEEELEDE